MNHFKYNCLTNQLWILDKGEPGFLYQIPEENQFSTQFGGYGFRLDNQSQHWITFTIYEKKIKAFYKQVNAKEEIIYYRKEQPRQTITEWIFTEQDQVEKDNYGKWKSKK